VKGKGGDRHQVDQIVEKEFDPFVFRSLMP